MKSKSTLITALVVVLLGAIVTVPAKADTKKIRVVTTLANYASIAQMIGGDKVIAESIVRGDQDPHFVRPKPSLAQKLTHADLFVSTGLDLEMWVPALVDMSRNDEIRSGQKRYVSASSGIKLMQVPQVISHSEGGVHIYGNPHIYTSPLNAVYIAKNIATGLAKIDPENTEYYQNQLKAFRNILETKLYGEELLRLVGGETLNRLAENERLIPFLEKKNYQGTALITRLGGWLGKGMVFRGKKFVAYHKNWAYFSQLFGFQVSNYIEPKPAIPPSPRHVEELIKQMQRENIDVILAANYYDENKIQTIADRVGAKAVIVQLGAGGEAGPKDFFEVIDRIVDALASASSK